MSTLRITKVENGYMVEKSSKTYVFGNISSMLTWIEDYYEPKKENPSNDQG